MEGGAGEGSDERVSAGSEGRDGREGGGEGVFFAGEEDGGDEGPVADVSQRQEEGKVRRGKTYGQLSLAIVARLSMIS